VNAISLAAGYLPTLCSNNPDSNLTPSRVRRLGSAAKETLRKTVNKAARVKADVKRAIRRTRAMLPVSVIMFISTITEGPSSFSYI